MRLRKYVLLLGLGGLACGDSHDDGAQTALADERAEVCERAHPRSASATLSLRASGDAALNCSEARAKCSDREDCVDCAWELLLGPDAAECIADAAGLQSGSEMRTQLEYDRDRRRPVWSVRRTLPHDGNPTSERNIVTMTIDARTGAVLERGGWSEIP